MNKPTILLIGILLVLPQMAHADGFVETCKAMYPLPERSINSVQESTGHDPRQFLIRRCITNARKKMAKERIVEREQIRTTSKFNRTSSRLQQLQELRAKGLSRDLAQQQNKREQLRVAPNRLGQSLFKVERSSRRTLIRGVEGVDRINAIRRNQRKRSLPNPCDSVKVIGKVNNPCQ